MKNQKTIYAPCAVILLLLSILFFWGCPDPIQDDGTVQLEGYVNKSATQLGGGTVCFVLSDEPMALSITDPSHPADDILFDSDLLSTGFDDYVWTKVKIKGQKATGTVDVGVDEQSAEGIKVINIELIESTIEGYVNKYTENAGTANESYFYTLSDNYLSNNNYDDTVEQEHLFNTNRFSNGFDPFVRRRAIVYGHLGAGDIYRVHSPIHAVPIKGIVIDSIEFVQVQQQGVVMKIVESEGTRSEYTIFVIPKPFNMDNPDNQIQTVIPPLPDKDSTITLANYSILYNNDLLSQDFDDYVGHEISVTGYVAMGSVAPFHYPMEGIEVTDIEVIQ